MKRYIASAIVALAASAALTSCTDVMSPKSGSYLYDEDLTLSNPNDSLYSTIGLLSKVQRLADRYVLLGELRGDMVTADPSTLLEYQEVANFAAQTNPTLLNRSDFYSVINQCNWMISKFSPDVKDGKQKELHNEYIAAVTYRAWTYLQLGLAYGKANWVTKPVLNLEDSEADYETLGFDQLVKKLIAELEPIAAEERANFGVLDNQISTKFFILPSALLADLMLYDGQYDRAAQLYWEAIRDSRATITDQPNLFTSSQQINATIGYSLTYTDEAVTVIPFSSNAKDYHPMILNHTINDIPALHPAKWWIDNACSKAYYFGSKNYVRNQFAKSDNGGDLRCAVRLADGTFTVGGSTASIISASNNMESLMITKFLNNATEFQGATTENKTLGKAAGMTAVATYRAPHLYLRFAEAVNRLGKPSLAYAVVRYGLNNDVLADSLKVNPAELTSGEQWLDWSSAIYDSNIGTAQRGRGYGFAYPDATDEDLPADLSADELMLAVEEIITDEMAAETCFEGNRFFDLMRIAHHRNDNSWFAAKVARRFSNPAEAESTLSDPTNWFIR